MIRQQIIEQLQKHRELYLNDPKAIVMSQHQERRLISELQGINSNLDVVRITEFHSIPVEVHYVFAYDNGDVVEMR